MKVRTGFVSNSSSSSFTCCVCGSEQSGYDLCLREAGMVQCIHGHTFCEDHMASEYETPEEDDEDDEGDDYPYGIDDKYCPVCQMSTFLEDDLVLYFLKISNRSIEDVESEIRGRFKTYDEFIEFIKGKKEE